jgi:hypothetical protein
MSYPSVTAYLREARFSLSIQLAIFAESNPEPDDSDNVILLALAEQLFMLVRQLARLTYLPRSTLHRRLT